MQSLKKRYAVLITDHPPVESIQQPYGDFGRMTIEALRSNDLNEEWVSYRVVDNEFPSDDELKTFDGILLTGSKYDAHAQDPWIQSLRKLVVKCATKYKEKKIVGICFGHQLVANALGGISGRSNFGWEVGVKHIQVSDRFMQIFHDYQDVLESLQGNSFKILEVHQDQVLELPDGAELLASSPNTRVEMFSWGKNVLCVQGHPEFNEHIVQLILEEESKDSVIPLDIANAGMKSLKEGTNNDSLRLLLKKFLHSN
jgi:GMP synthase-like glutamine amidotransferase